MSKTHLHTSGRKFSPTYHSWCGMKARCTNPKNAHYQDYGGRGLSYCVQWESFEVFLSDMGEKPKGMSLDRIDFNQGYFPENCRWATPSEQARNKRNNTQLTANGKTQCMQTWAEELKIPPATLSYRINHGWSHEAAINTPVLPRKQTALHRKTTRWITHDGKTMCLSDWARYANISVTLLHSRLARGLPIEQALIK